MPGRGGSLWNVPRDTRRTIVLGLNGVRVRARYSLDGSLDQQAVIEGIVHARETDVTVFHIQRDNAEPDNARRKYTAVIFARLIDIVPIRSIASMVPHPPQQRRRDDACQNCLGIDQPPDRLGVPNHCGECPCCRTR